MTAEQVGMMPIYIGDPDEQDEGLATGSENYWCINSKASEACLLYTSDAADEL